MREFLAKKLSRAFETVHINYAKMANGEKYSKLSLHRAGNRIYKIQQYIENYSCDIERDFLLLCINALQSSMSNADNAKTAALAYALHRVPFIFSGDEEWNKDFVNEYIVPFCKKYGSQSISGLLKMQVAKIKKEDLRSMIVYRYNRRNDISLFGYFCSRMFIPIFLISTTVLGSIVMCFRGDYTEENCGEMYILENYTVEEQTPGDPNFLNIISDNYEAPFTLNRVYEELSSPEKLLELLGKGEKLIVYATYTKANGILIDSFYTIIHLEDEQGNVYRSLEQSNKLEDRYLLRSIGIFWGVCFICMLPFLIIPTLMLIVALNRKKFVSHPRLVIFCFPNYSLRLDEES